MQCPGKQGGAELRGCVFPPSSQDPNPAGEAFGWGCSFLIIASFVSKCDGKTVKDRDLFSFSSSDFFSF